MNRKAPKLGRGTHSKDLVSQYICTTTPIDGIVLDSIIPGSRTVEKVLNVLKEDKLSLEEKLKVVNNVLNYLMELHKLADSSS